MRERNGWWATKQTKFREFLLPMHVDLVLDHFGGSRGIAYLITRSSYNRKFDGLPRDEADDIKFFEDRVVPARIMIRLALAYQELTGQPLDLSRYYTRNSGPIRKVVRPSLVYKNGRRVKRQELAAPMTGFMR